MALDEETVTSDTEIDVDETTCFKCGRIVNLHAEEIYHEYKYEESRMQYLCRTCVDTGNLRKG